MRRIHMPMCPTKDIFLVIVISYKVVMNDRRFLAKHKWKYIIMDEAKYLLHNPFSSIFRCRSSLSPLLQHKYSFVHKIPSLVKSSINLKSMLLFQYWRVYSLFSLSLVATSLNQRSPNSHKRLLNRKARKTKTSCTTHSQHLGDIKSREQWSVIV